MAEYTGRARSLSISPERKWTFSTQCAKSSQASPPDSNVSMDRLFMKTSEPVPLRAIPGGNEAGHRRLDGEGHCMGIFRRKFLVFLFLALLVFMLFRLAGCSAREWTTWVATGLPSAHFSQNVLTFFDERTAYFGGLLKNGPTGEAALFRSDDGGRDWRRLPLPESRLEVTHIAGQGRDVYICLGGLHTPSIFLYSPDGGESWTEIIGAEAGVRLSKSGAMALDSAGRLRIGGTATEPPDVPVLLVREPGGTLTRSLLPDNSLLKISGHSSLLLPVNADFSISEARYLEGGPTVPLPLPLSRIIPVERAPGPDCSWWLCGVDETGNRRGPVRILRLTPTECEATELRLAQNDSPSLITAHGRTFCITASTGSSIFGASHVLYVSRDGGATLQKTAPRFTLIMEPAFQYKEEFYIVAQQNAKFARLDFKALDGWFW